MKIVGCENGTSDVHDVHTIDVWYSRRRETWIVERLDVDGGQVGHAHACATRDDAEACVAEWLRAHAGTQLVGTELAARRRAVRRAA